MLSFRNYNRIGFVVKVGEGENSYGTGNKYIIGENVSPELFFQRNLCYEFDLNHPSLETHDLRISTTADGTHNDGIVYSDNVELVQTPKEMYIMVTDSTPDTLYYFCINHPGMGGTITVK
tara:strand:- start:265 stop:624 length:360 start_codon:yes stop_codon:yes gene_type:complete